MNIVFPFTDAGIEAYRAWSDEAEDHRQALQDETQALCDDLGVSFDEVFWDAMSGEDMQRHDYLLEVVRDANITPTKPGYFKVQKFGFELYELEKRLYAGAMRRCKKQGRRNQAGASAETIKAGWEARRIRMATQSANSESTDRRL